MARASRLVQVYNVQCVMCGRAAGQVMNGLFVKSPRGCQPVTSKFGPRCGDCGGNLYLEPDEAITPFMASQVLAQHQPRAGRGAYQVAA